MTSQEPALTQSTGTLTVFYDGACPLCSAEISVYRKSAGADGLSFVDVSTPSGSCQFPSVDKAAALARFHVLSADGTLSSGAEGFGRLWLALPGWRWLGRIVMMPGILQATEAVYRGFLLVRPALQRMAHAGSVSGSKS